jgi:hypothetical protein
VLQNGVLRRFEPQRDKVAGSWRRSFITCTLHEILSGGQAKEYEMGRAYSTYGEIRNAYKILVVKREGRRPRGTPRRRWEDNIRMDLREIGW